MSIVISPSYVIADSASGGGVINADSPVIGWRNLVQASALQSTTAVAGFPVSNLGNPSTDLIWQGVVSDPEQDEYITLGVSTVDDVDYVGIAGHNFGSAQIPVSIEYLDVEADPDAWVELIAPVILPDDGPAIFRFPPQAVADLRIRMQPGDAAPEAAVVYAGKLLVLQRHIQVGHTPIVDGRMTTVVNGRSESGRFLGRIVTGQSTESVIEMANLTPDWYRANMRPFLRQAQESPFFFAWRPSTYPREVGYCWLANDPKPTNQLAAGHVQVSLKIEGVV
jgi:hypothetical protein